MKLHKAINFIRFDLMQALRCNVLTNERCLRDAGIHIIDFLFDPTPIPILFKKQGRQL